MYVYAYMSLLFQRYIETADRQRERYLREFDDYQRSEAYKQFMKSKFEGKSFPTFLGNCVTVVMLAFL